MEEKRCTGCGVVKQIDEFAFQQKNPTRRYAWCTPCRGVAVRINGYRQEVRTMQAKGKSLKSLPADKVELVKMYRARDLNAQAIAAKIGVPEIVICRTLKKLDKLAVGHGSSIQDSPW